MLVLDEKSSGVVLLRSRPLRAVALAGSLGSILSLLPLVMAPDPGAIRLLCFVALAASSAALVFLGRSRPERLELVQKPGGLTWGDEPLPPPAYVTLGGDGTEEPPAYQALIGWADGRERVALQAQEPAEVLRGAFELAKRLGLELRPGWGLERHFGGTALAREWEVSISESPGSRTAPSARVDLPLWPVQRNTAAITLSAGAFVIVVTAVLVRSPERSVGPSALELALPGLAACLTLALGAVFLGIRRRLELSTSGIDSTLVLFGRSLGKRTTLGPVAARAFGVAPAGGPTRHVVFATSSGPVAVYADPPGADRLVVRGAETAAAETAAVERPRNGASARYFSTLPRS